MLMGIETVLPEKPTPGPAGREVKLIYTFPLSTAVGPSIWSTALGPFLQLCHTAGFKQNSHCTYWGLMARRAGMKFLLSLYLSP